MALYTNLTNDITPSLILSGGQALIHDNETMVTTVAGPDIVNNTVLGYNPTTLKWTPLINVAATDGSAWPKGIYQGETILAATIQAGDVTGLKVIVGAEEALFVDEAKLVFEAGTVTLASIVGPAAAAGVERVTVRQALESMQIFPVPTQNFDLIQPIA